MIITGRTIYHLANDCNDTFTLIQVARSIRTLCCRLLNTAIKCSVLGDRRQVLHFNIESKRKRRRKKMRESPRLFINLANRKCAIEIEIHSFLLELENVNLDMELER